jgi:peptidoglycan/xylan/chitin deacetylase (PgdA/CDA1 family)
MRVPGIKALRLGFSWLHSRVANYVLVLGYHRIAQKNFDPFDLCVQPQHFEEHLEVIEKRTSVIDLKTLQEGLQNGSLPRKAVVITFDDAYQDVLYTVKPMLAARNMPATTFVVTGNLGQEYWWDELAFLICGPTVLPDQLFVKIGTETIIWPETSYFALNQKESSNPRRDLLDLLYQRMLHLPTPHERIAVLEQLKQSIKISDPEELNIAKAMTAAELQNLTADGLVCIGSHTETHPILPHLSGSEQCLELENSRLSLEVITGQPVKYFSFPNGKYSKESCHMVRSTGYKLAFTSRLGIVHRGLDRFTLPRFWIPDWNGEQFERWLRKWIKQIFFC